MNETDNSTYYDTEAFLREKNKTVVFDRYFFLIFAVHTILKFVYNEFQWPIFECRKNF